MYKSKYNIPLEVNHTGTGKSNAQRMIQSDDVLYAISKIYNLTASLVKSTVLVLWALISGIISFGRGVWKDSPWLKQLPWGKIAILALVSYLLLGKGLGFSIDMNNPLGNAALLIPSSIEEKGEKEEEKTLQVIEAEDRTNDLSPISPALLKHPDVHDFIKRFEATAKEEMKLYGIPASIKMGQAIIESQAGKSTLAAGSNNFFGIKCKPKCLGCTCKNYADDNKYDMFRVFDSAWESWRAHSKLLCNPRYSKLPLYGKDYKKWAHGLKKAGYATDPSYATKLINVIEKYNLTMLDQ